jgi:hypothetical protein
MASSPSARWESHRGDEWWWSAAPNIEGSLNPATATFSVDQPPDDNAARLWALLAATSDQFPDLQMECGYDARIKVLLDQLQAEGKLRWSDAGHPHSRYARIEVVQRPPAGPHNQPLQRTGAAEKRSWFQRLFERGPGR